jgi:PIN domain nuclease of toxin-antitoxin system
MKILLDTHVLLWAANQDKRLTKNCRKLLEDSENELFFSAASIWEVAIKSQLKRDDFQVDPRMLRRGLIDNGYSEIAVTSEHAANVDLLPDIHRDPFDRILVAQSIAEGLLLLTADSQIARYPTSVRLAR